MEEGRMKQLRQTGLQRLKREVQMEMQWLAESFEGRKTLLKEIQVVKVLLGEVPPPSKARSSKKSKR